MMTTIYFIRHAEAEGNLYRRLHGQHDTLLTPAGVRQAEALRRRFAGVRLHACYASDLNRAVQTALPVCKDHRLRLRREPAFREVCFGTWEDQSFGTLEHLYPEQMRVFRQNMWAWQAPGSETLEQATGRFIEALRAVAERHAGQTVAIFTHGAILRAVQAELFFTRQTMNRAGRCDNTGVSRVQYEGGRFTLDYLNDNAHLDLALSTQNRLDSLCQRSASLGEDYNLWFELAQDGGALYMDLRRQNWVQRCGTLTWTDAAAVEAQMRAILARAPNTLYYARQGQALVGALLLEPEQEQDYGVIRYLGVLPERKYRGFAVQLLGQAVSHCRSQGKSKIRCTIPDGDYTTVHFFEKYGFRPRKQAGGERCYELSIALPRQPG